MAKSKSKSKSKSKAGNNANAGSGKAPPKSTFVLNASHKQFLARRAEEHAAALREEKPGIIAKATEELLREYSITRKEDIAKAKKVVKAWLYDRNDRGETVIPVTKFGFLKEMTAQRIWCYEQKLFITETVQTIVPGGPSDPNWIGEFSHQSTLLWKEACKDPELLEQFTEKAERFRQGQASLSMKASYGDFCFADFCRTVVNYAWRKFGATVVLMTSRPTHKTNTGSMKDMLVVYDKDPENPHRITFTDAYPQGNWTCNDFVSFAQGPNPSQDGISHKAYVLFHPSGEPMLPEWNFDTPVKQKRDILLHFLRVNYVMATSIPSAHPPYKMIIDGNLSDYISCEYRPEMVHGDPFQFRKPGEIKVAHLDTWLSLIQGRQDRFLRREVDQIFRFASIKGEGPVPKPALYNPEFMRNYALEHGPLYSLTPSQPVSTPAERTGEERASATRPTESGSGLQRSETSLEEQRVEKPQTPDLTSEEQPGKTAEASRSESPSELDREQGLGLEREISIDSEETQQHVMFEPDSSPVGTLETPYVGAQQPDDDDGDEGPSNEDDQRSDEDGERSDQDEQNVDNYLGFDNNGVTISDAEMGEEPSGNASTSGTSRVDQSVGPTRTHLEENVDVPVPEQESCGVGIVDELEGSLQELEESTSGTAVSEPSRNTPRWAGSVRSRRLEFLANLCENKDYQDILVRLREFPYTNTKVTKSLEWSDWNSDLAYLPREVHLEREVTLRFTKYLLSWKKDANTTISDPHKLEEFLLTVGLAYRDMVALHADRDLATVRQTLPDYMNASCSLLTRRMKDVCDTILRHTREVIEHHTLNASLVAQTQPVARDPHKPSRRRQTGAHAAGTTVPIGQSSSLARSTIPPTARREDIPIILPPVKPRKRNRNELEPAGLDEDTTFIVKRARIQFAQPDGIRKSSRGHIPKKISEDFEPTVPVMNRRNRG